MEKEEVEEEEGEEEVDNYLSIPVASGPTNATATLEIPLVSEYLGRNPIIRMIQLST